MLRYSASADTVLRKWLPIADSSKAESLVFPGDAVEFLRLPPGRSAAGRGGGGGGSGGFGCAGDLRCEKNGTGSG